MKQSTHFSSSYRADIDGLRAVAVVGVLLAHAKVPFFSGGFVGVDVFFVISGYLITKILIRENEGGTFSVLNFYERRVRRIFPALYFMISIVSMVAWFVLMPFDFKEFSEEVVAVSFFISNFYFDIRSGYFDVGADFRLLLHTWSLGVEEQFYLIFPLFLVAIFKLRLARHMAVILIVFWLISFVASQWNLQLDSQSTFYLPWFRAWELLTGSIVAARVLDLHRWRINFSTLAVVGLAGIVVPIFGYSSETDFPGLMALPPVLGTALIIMCGERRDLNSAVRGFLEFPIVVYLGRISYSLYLWHWPPLVYLRYTSIEEPGATAVWLAVAGAVGVSIVSYHLIEQPVRQLSKVSSSAVFAAGALAVALSTGFGLSSRLTQGMPWRLSEDVQKISLVGFDRNPRRSECDQRSTTDISSGLVCIGGAKDAPASFAVIGDSYADAFVPGIIAAAEVAGTAGYIYTYGGCYPIIGTNAQEGECDSFYRAATQAIAGDNNIESVIVVARWSSAFEASRFGVDSRPNLFITDGENSELSVSTTREVVEGGLRRVLARLSGKRVYVVAFVPEQMYQVPRALGLDALLGRDEDEDDVLGVPYPVFAARQAFSREVLNRLSGEFGFALIDVGALMCDSELCPAEKEGIPLYVDDNHISRTTSVSLRGLFNDAVAK